MSGALSHCRTVFGVEEKNIKKKNAQKWTHVLLAKSEIFHFYIPPYGLLFRTNTIYRKRQKKERSIAAHTQSGGEDLKKK